MQKLKEEVRGAAATFSDVSDKTAPIRQQLTQAKTKHRAFDKDKPRQGQQMRNSQDSQQRNSGRG